MQCLESFVSYLKFYEALQGYSTFMTSSIENASLTLDVPVSLIFSGFSLNRFYMLASVFTLVLMVSGLLRGAPFGSALLSSHPAAWLQVGFHGKVLSFTF